MKQFAFAAGLLFVLTAPATTCYASDPVALYARVDRVVLEPDAGSPNTIQVWGVFSIAKPNDRNDFLPPARGYLYFKLAGNPDAARREWADLEQVAGTGQIVALGSRYELHAQVRNPADRPENPDPYAVSIGLTRMRSTTDYPPVRALLDVKR